MVTVRSICNSEILSQKYEDSVHDQSARLNSDRPPPLIIDESNQYDENLGGQMGRGPKKYAGMNRRRDTNTSVVSGHFASTTSSKTN